MIQNRNLIVFDFETSGLDPKDGAEVVQIAAKAINAWDFSDHHAGELCLLIKPQNPDKASARAIEVIGPIWPESMKNGLEPTVAWSKFMDFTRSVNDTKTNSGKPIMAGWNTDFDVRFRDFTTAQLNLVKNRDDAPWGFPLDVMMLSWSLFESDNAVQNLKLDTIANLLGLKRSTNTHDAMEDVRITTNILQRELKFLRKCKERMRVASSPIY